MTDWLESAPMRNLENEFVDAAAPLDEDAGEATEGAGVGHVRRVRDRHRRASLGTGKQMNEW